MKTKDGHEINLGRTYHLENGQEVMVNSCAITSDGKHAFMVTPLYEGQAMEVSGDGGSHHEYTMDYEHEGMDMLVSSIFVDPPIEKLCRRYADKLKAIENLTLSIGELKAASNRISVSKRTLERESANQKIVYAANLKSSEKSKSELSDINEKVSESRQQLSELQDSIIDLKTEDVSSLVSRKELQRLNKRDFKMDCLEAGGLDNWEWYDESLKDYRERYPEG